MWRQVAIQAGPAGAGPCVRAAPLLRPSGPFGPARTAGSNLCVDVCAGATGAAVLWARAAGALRRDAGWRVAGPTATARTRVGRSRRAMTSADCFGEYVGRFHVGRSGRPIRSADHVGEHFGRSCRPITSGDFTSANHVGRSCLLSLNFFIHPVSPILVGRSGGGARRLARVDEAVPSYAKSTDRCKEPCSVLIALCKRWDSG